MGIRSSVSGSAATITLVGRFDFSLHGDFRETYDLLLVDSEIDAVAVNLAGVEYIDSSALGMLLMLRERAQETGKSLTLCKPSSHVSHLLEIVSFSKLFTIE